MKVKAISRGHYIDSETNETKQIEKSMIVDVSDEELLHLEGYAATNYLYDKCDSAWNIMALSREYEIIEDGLAKDIPYLHHPFVKSRKCGINSTRNTSSKFTDLLNS